MKLHSLRVETQPQLMIIPLIDIMFFLLVFFMMSTLYMVEQHTIPVNLPQAASTQQETPNNTNVTILENGDILFNQEIISFSQLTVRVNQELTTHTNTVFILRGDKEAAYGKIISVLDCLKQAGATQVSVAVEQTK